MKKPIDPNLNNLNDDDFLLPDRKSRGNGTFNFADSSLEQGKRQSPNFTVTENDDAVSKPNDDLLAKIDEASHQHHTSSDDYHASSHHHSDGSSSHHHSSSSSGHHHSSSSSSHHHHSSSSHHSSHSSSHSSKKKKKLPLPARIAIAVIVILLLIVVVVGATFFILQQSGKSDLQTDTQEVNYEETITYNGHKYNYNKNIVSIAFMGVDARQLETSDETDFVGAADADIVLAVDTKTGTASAIAIPRDTMVDIDINSSSGTFLKTANAQLCLAYAYGDGTSQSCTNVTSAMSRILYDVPIDKYYALDLDGIAPLNDAIGGVTVESLYDFEDLGISVGDTVTLEGDMAETYVRTRSLDNINASLNRTDRQVQYIKAYASQVVPAVMKDFGVVSTLYNTASKYSQTNLTLNNATYIATLLLSKGVTDFKTYTLEGEMKSSTASDFPDAVRAEFYPDEDNLMQTVLEVFYTQVD